MSRLSPFRTAALVALVALLPGAWLAVPADAAPAEPGASMPSPLPVAPSFAASAASSASALPAPSRLDARELAAERRVIDETTREALQACRALIRNERDVCRVSALARRDSLRAWAVWRHSGLTADWRAFARTQAMGQFEIAKQHCDDPGAPGRHECINDASRRRDAALRAAARDDVPPLVERKPGAASGAAPR